MKKLVLSLIVCIFVFSGIEVTDTKISNLNNKNIAAGGGEREPSILSIRSSTV